jgi:cell division protein FtsA
MENNKIAVGLDIGTTKIVVMVGQKNEFDKVEILGIGKSKSLGVHRGVVNNITQTIQSIQQATLEANAKSGITVKEVVVGIAGQHIRSLQHSDYITRENADEVINEQDIETLINQVYKLVMLPGEEIIHVLPQEYKVDGQAEIKEPIGMYGGRLEANFHVVVGQVSSIRNIGRCINSAGLDMGKITLEPIASSDAVLSQEEKEAGVALIDIGGGTTDLAIFKDGIIRHTAVIPFGGNVITEDIKEGCSIIQKQAELLKVKFGSAWPGENKETEIVSIPGLRGRDPKEISLKTLSKIINARVIEIIEQAYLEIKNYGHEDQKKKLIAGIVLTGGGSQLKHLKQLVEYITGMDTRVGYPNEHLAGDTDEQTTSPMYATAVGLLMAALEKGPAETLSAEASVEGEEGTKVQESETVSQTELTKNRNSVLERWTDKFKEFLDKA